MSLSPPAAAPAAPSARRIWLSAVVLVGAAVAAYHNTFSAPFVFDDIPAITGNPTIRDWRTPRALTEAPPLRGTGVAGRPMVNLSLALNHALGGEAVWGYHALNLLIHAGAGLVLFGVVRRTLASRAGFSPLFGHAGFSEGGLKPALPRDALPVAFAVALLWLVHPLQTESVTCVIQRTESLMGFFYLLTLYCFIRSVEAPAAVGWRVACWAACVLGAATKEVMATAPLMVLLYDRTFVAGTFREAWRQRGRLHLALASTWVLIALLVWRSETRGGTVGFGHGVAWWEYALTQCRAVVHYLKLSWWPHPLVLDYGTEVVRDPLAVWPQGLLLAVLVTGTVWALWRRPFGLAQGRPALGFLGAWFFVILAPSSSVVPLVTQTMAEHRMYLPLAAVAVLAVVTARAVAGRWSLAVGVAMAVALGVATVRRNADYRTVESIWRDNLAKWPANVRAHYTLAQLAEDGGRLPEAVELGEAAVRLRPGDATAHFNLAFSLAKAGRLAEAAEHYAQAARIEPAVANAHINLGAVLVRLGRFDEAMAEYETVVRLLPDSGEDRFNLAQIYFHEGRLAEALRHYEAAVRLKPDSAEAHYRIGNARVKLGRMEDAAAAYREAVRRSPDFFEAHVNLAGALLALGRAAEAVPVYERALQLQPGDAAVGAQLERAREQARRP